MALPSRRPNLRHASCRPNLLAHSRTRCLSALQPVSMQDIGTDSQRMQARRPAWHPHLSRHPGRGPGLACARSNGARGEGGGPPPTRVYLSIYPYPRTVPCNYDAFNPIPDTKHHTEEGYKAPCHRLQNTRARTPSLFPCTPRHHLPTRLTHCWTRPRARRSMSVTLLFCVLR